MTPFRERPDRMARAFAIPCEVLTVLAQSDPTAALQLVRSLRDFLDEVELLAVEAGRTASRPLSWRDLAGALGIDHAALYRHVQLAKAKGKGVTV